MTQRSPVPRRRAGSLAALALLLASALVVVAPPVQAQAPGCPAPYDYSNPSYNSPPQTGIPPNRCPVAVLNPDLTVSENCSATNCWGQGGDAGVTFRLTAEDSYDPDFGDPMYFHWSHVATYPSTFGWAGITTTGTQSTVMTGCTKDESECVLHPPHLKPSDPAKVVLVFQLRVSDRDPTPNSGMRLSLPTIVNVTVVNSDQAPFFVDFGVPSNAYGMDCLPHAPVPCQDPGRINQVTRLPVTETVDIINDRGHSLRTMTYYIQDEQGIVTVDAYFVDSETQEVRLQTSLQKGICSSTYSATSPESCQWADNYTRPGLRSPGIPVDTRHLIVGQYDVRLVAHDAHGGAVATEPGTNILVVLPGVGESGTGPPGLGVVGVKELPAAASNHCFPGSTRVPQQVLGPGQQIRLNVTVPVPEMGPDVNGRLALSDPFLFLWKVTTQVCTSYRSPSCPPPDNVCALISQEIPLNAPYLLRRENLKYGDQEVRIRAYDRFRQMSEVVVPVAFLEQGPLVKAVLPQRTFANVTFPIDVLVHAPVDHSTLLSVLNYTVANGQYSQVQQRQFSTGNVRAHVPTLGSAHLRDVVVNGPDEPDFADFILDLDGDRKYDHVFDYANLALYQLVTYTDPKTRSMKYIVDLNSNKVADQAELPSGFGAERTGRIHELPIAVLRCATPACEDKAVDVDGDGKDDNLVDVAPDGGGDGIYDHFVRDSSTDKVPVLEEQVYCLDLPVSPCLAPFEDALDIDGDGRLDVTLDGDGDGIPEAFIPFGDDQAIDLYPSGLGWSWRATPMDRTYYPDRSGSTVLAFLREAPTTVFRFDLQRNLLGRTSFRLHVDDVVGHTTYMTGNFTTEAASIDARAVTVQVNRTGILLVGDTVELIGLVSMADGPRGIQPVKMRVTFDGKEAQACPDADGKLLPYPPSVALKGAFARACLPGALYPAGTHSVRLAVITPTGLTERDASNNAVTSTFEVYLGKVVDGKESYYIRSDGRGLPDTRVGGGGAVKLDENGQVESSYDLTLDQSVAQAVYRFKVPTTTRAPSGGNVATTRDLYWDPGARALRDGTQVWLPGDAKTADSPCRLARTGSGELDPECRAVTVVSPAKSTTSPTPSTNGSPAPGALLMALALLALAAVVARRRRA